MCDVRKSVVRLIAMGLAVGLLAGAAGSANAQSKKPQQKRARRETNASREARIAHTVQETYSNRYEVFGGGGFLRFTPGADLKKMNEISWAASTTYFLNWKLGITGSAQGSFGRAQSLQGYENYNVYINNPQINEYFFMAGPTYRFYTKEKFALSGTAQAGAAWGIFGGGSKGIPPATLGLWNDSTRLGWSLGLSGDYNFYPNLAFRVTPTYIGTNFGSKIQSNFGFNAGVVYRFGRQK
jgi:hypothetical protein